MLLLALGAAGIALFHGSAVQVAAWFAVCGLGIGFAFAAMPKLIVDSVEPSETGVANGMNTVIRIVGGVIGAQVGAVLLANGALAGGRVPGESGFVHAFWISAIGGVVGAVMAALVLPRRNRSARARATTELAAE
jgi:MFS family permease